mmetsp:Transcript_5585/g.17665  ORF Transcript_5585/g.17665 Transcript_5585/m.17665 type:complete len:547 (+) Transcript_5585:235-1875(+)
MRSFAVVVALALLGAAAKQPAAERPSAQPKAAAQPGLVEVFELQVRASAATKGQRSAWAHSASVDAFGADVPPALRDAAPAGCVWATEWILDRSGACDGDGWSYAHAAQDLGTDDSHARRDKVDKVRRRRWIRVVAPVAPGAAPAPAVPSGFGHLTSGALHPRLAHVARGRSLAGSAARAVREDFTFRGFGLGVTRAALGAPIGSSAGAVLQIPLSPNFASWDRRAFLPMVSAMIVTYPANIFEQCGTAARFHGDAAPTNVAVILSVSYPLEVLRDGLLSLRLRRRGEKKPFTVKLGATSVQRVGFSLSTTVSPGGVGAVMIRPWFMYAPGLRLVADLVIYLLSRALAAVQRRIAEATADAPLKLAAPEDAADSNDAARSKDDAPLEFEAAVASKDKFNAKEDGDKGKSDARRPGGEKKRKRGDKSREAHAQPSRGPSKDELDEFCEDTLLANANATTAEPSAARRRGDAPVALRIASGALSESLRTLKAWCGGKTSTLGYSFLPFESHSLAYDQRGRPAAPPFRPWRGSVVFSVRPFFPFHPGKY